MMRLVFETVHQRQATLCALAACIVALNASVAISQVQPMREDTIRLTLKAAEEKFLKNNFQLLAAKLNIEASKALEIQAGLWNNPNFSVESNPYNRELGQWFNYGDPNSNVEVTLQQLFLLAGKRDKQLSLAQIQTKASESAFYDVLRALKFQLRTSFYAAHYLGSVIAFYDESLRMLDSAIKEVEAISDKRMILPANALRLRALSASLQSERAGFAAQVSDAQSALQTLLSDTTRRPVYVVPDIDSNGVEQASLKNISLERLIMIAEENRPDLKIAETSVAYESKNLDLQKALAIPDLTLGLHYSRSGAAGLNYIAVQASIDLPFFNRNQGAILASEKTLEVNKRLLEQKRLSVVQEVIAAYRKALEVENATQAIDANFATQYRTFIANVVQNYKKRNLSLLEFTDFFESYRAAMVQIRQLQIARITALENLNYVTGATVVNP